MEKIKSNLNICFKLMKLIDKLKFKMILAIIAGSVGNIMASLIPTLGAYGITKIIYYGKFNYRSLAVFLIILAIVRSLLRYLEQLCNHDVAFTTLAIIRDKIFKKLRVLAPAKMQTKDSGDMISIITSDIELLEVFYAHTISPVAIALIHTIVITIILSKFSIYYSMLLLAFHLIMAIIVPVITSNRAKNTGNEQRKDLSVLNSSILDTFRGIKECMQYNYGEKRAYEIKLKNRKLKKSSRKLSKIMGENFALSNAVIIIANLFMLLLAGKLYTDKIVDIQGVILPIVLFTSSFGPVSALSALANNLLLTFACGDRVLSLLEEEPTTCEIVDGKDVNFEKLNVEKVSFGYDNVEVLKDANLEVSTGNILGISGKSGCGKSTLLKLIMRFYDVDSGEIEINDENIKNINTKSLWSNISYITQSTHIFNDTIIENLRIAKKDATIDEIIDACKKASIHEFIETLPEGYNTVLDNVNNNLSTGEKQRLSIARAFLRDSKLMLLDEPTANIDSLNEGIVLKAIWERSKEKATILVSHKDSTLRIADKIIKFKEN